MTAPASKSCLREMRRRTAFLPIEGAKAIRGDSTLAMAGARPVATFFSLHDGTRHILVGGNLAGGEGEPQACPLAGGGPWRILKLVGAEFAQRGAVDDDWIGDDTCLSVGDQYARAFAGEMLVAPGDKRQNHGS